MRFGRVGEDEDHTVELCRAVAYMSLRLYWKNAVHRSFRTR